MPSPAIERDSIVTLESEPLAGVSLRALAVAALLASVVGRGIAPAIPGFAIGLDRSIWWSGRIAAFLSQLVAAGGVAAVLRLATLAFRKNASTLGYRLFVFPCSAIVVALVVASFSGPLPTELCRTLALAAIVSALAAGVTCIGSAETRAAGLVLALAGAAGLLRFSARGFASRAAEHHEPRALQVLAVALTLATLLEVIAMLITGRYVAGRDPRRAGLLLGALAVASVAIAAVASRGATASARPAELFLLRALGSFSRAANTARPALALYALAVAPIILATAALSTSRERAKTGTVLALCLMSLGALDMPLPALLIVIAALLAARPV